MEALASEQKNSELIATGEATAILPARNNKCSPIRVIGTQAIRDGFDETCLKQARNARSAPGVSDLVLNPDAHAGYGAPVGCVLVSPTHIYPGPVGVDIKCSMSLLQLDLPAEAVADKSLRREIIKAIAARVPTGTGKGDRSVPKGRKVNEITGRRAVVEGASRAVCEAIGIPASWALKCEDSSHTGHDDTRDALSVRLDWLIHQQGGNKLREKLNQLGSYGGGNHFGECEIVNVTDNDRARFCASNFGLLDNSVAFLSHCGSRGFGHELASQQFATLQNHFVRWGIPYPAGDRQLVYAPLGTIEANNYLDDMALGANFATVNHLLINALVLEAFQEVIPGVQGDLVYLISHNIARKEVVDNQVCWVHRKGATRAFPAGHFSLKDTVFANTGHPILLPGNPVSGSVVMVANKGAKGSCYSVNHGAGRALGRKKRHTYAGPAESKQRVR